MTAQPAAKRSFKQALFGKVYSIASKPGWFRWALLAIAALVFVLVALAFCGGTTYQDDPSTMVPRSARMYMETRDLDSLLRTSAGWKLWKSERRAKSDEQRNQLQIDLAGLIGSQVAGLGTRLPLAWLVDAKQAAYCVNQDEEGQESWALFLRNDNASQVLSDIAVEPGLNVEAVSGTTIAGVSKLTGTGTGELYFGILTPWLIISSQATLPQFAIENSRRPAFSLSRSGLLPQWRRGVVMRGVVNPAFQIERAVPSVNSVVGNWIDPDVRVSYTAKTGRNGIEVTYDSRQLAERVAGSGLWPLFAVLLAVLGILALVVVFAIVLVMVGWGGWMKTMAMRDGVKSAAAPAEVTPSAAFTEDSGAATKAESAPPAAAPTSSDPVEDSRETTAQNAGTDTMTVDGGESENKTPEADSDTFDSK